jgi:hypothetical protein
VASLLAIGLYEPLSFVWRNHPNEYVFYNALIGGTRGAYLHYELDYLGNCIKTATRWASAQAEDLGRTLEIGGSDPFPSVRIQTEETPNLRYLGDNRRDGDLFIQLLRGRPDELKAMGDEKGILFTVAADGAPLCYVKAGSKWASNAPRMSGK